MGTQRKTKKFSWGSALIGAAAAAAASLAISAKPRDPTFHVISIDLTSFKLSFPSVDAEMTLTVHVTNPNAVPIHYTDTDMSIYYAGSLLGSAPVQAGSQPPRSCQLLRLPARLSGLQLAHHGKKFLAHHGKKFLADLGRREMVLESTVDISGAAKVMWWWDHRFKVHVDSHVVVDPVLLDVIDQENISKLEIFVKS